MSAAYFYSLLKNSNLKNNEINKALELENTAATQARNEYRFFGNKKSRFESIIENNLIQGDSKILRIEIPLTQLLKKTYSIERSASYKLKKQFNPEKYKKEQHCIQLIRQLVYLLIACDQNRLVVKDILNNHQQNIDLILKQHPSLKECFARLEDFASLSTECTILFKE